MAPKNKFTREEMVAAALRVVRRKGADALTAKALAEELGTSTQPVFTCFGTMDALKAEVSAAAEELFDEYIQDGLREKIPFLGFGIHYVLFAWEEPALYRMLLLSPVAGQAGGALRAMSHAKELVSPRLMEFYHISRGDADRYFRDMWLVAHSLASLAVTGVCFEREELEQIMTGFSMSLLRSIKEIPGFADNTYDRDTVFSTMVNG